MLFAGVVNHSRLDPPRADTKPSNEGLVLSSGAMNHSKLDSGGADTKLSVLQRHIWVLEASD